MSRATGKKVLICGASIAGPTLGYWLTQYGFDVTLVEKTDTIRSGGYAIDIRGTALGVVEPMGILPALRASRIHRKPFIFYGPHGRKLGKIQPEVLMGADEGRDIEIARGELTGLLYDKTRDLFEYRFEDCIESLSDEADGVDVNFRSGRRERFDLVLSADGLHSATRELVFGPEAAFSRYLGFFFALFSVRVELGLGQQGHLYNKVGKLVALYGRETEGMTQCMMVSKRPLATREEQKPEAVRAFLRETFRDDGWKVPEILAALDSAEDIYADSMTQIRLGTWSKGRVALVGDAAYGPSFFSGQGTGIALVGAYVLAGELARHADHRDAFAAYETRLRDYIALNQDLAYEGGATLVPSTSGKLLMRNTMIRLSPILGRLGLISQQATKAYTALDLPDYSDQLVSAEAAG